MNNPITVEATLSDQASLNKAEFGDNIQRFRYGEVACKLEFGQEDQPDRLELRLPARTKVEIVDIPANKTAHIVEQLEQLKVTNKQDLPSNIGQLLKTAVAEGAKLKSSLGNAAIEITENLRKLIWPAQEAVKKVLNKTAVNFRELTCGPNKRPLHWVNITNPTEAALRSIAGNFEIDFVDLKRILNNKRVPNCYRNDQYLFACLDELISDEHKGSLRLKKQTVYVIMNENFIITVCDQTSPTVQHVWNEISNNPRLQEKLESSTYLFSRLLGAALHRNEEEFMKFEDRCNAFIKRNSETIPGRRSQARLNEITVGLKTALKVIRQIPVIISALKEERNLFGAGRPVDSLERYAGIRAKLEEEIEDTREAVGSIRHSWETLMAQSRANKLDKIAVVTCLTAIPSTVAGIFGMNILNWYAYSALTASAVLAMGLVAYLYYQNRKSQKELGL